MRPVWDEAAWHDFKRWQTADRKILTHINMLIDACLRDPFSTIGKPEQPTYAAQGSWSRRIADEHRLVDLVDGEDLVILQARYHC